MAKYGELFEDYQAMFNDAIEAADLSRFVVVTILTNNKAKDLYKVTKANDLLKFRTGDDVIIIVNENIFDKLTDDQQRIVVEEAISYISFDPEHDRVTITQPDFMVHSGVLRKYGFETIQAVRETVKALFQSEKETEDETNAIV